VLALFGPTAAGKSALAHAAAVEFGGEVVVADPFQRYRGLEIAADSPRSSARAEVAYHLVGDLDLTEGSTAADFAARAHRAVDDIAARGRVPIVAGGTGLYVRAALADLDFAAPPDPEARDRAEALVADDRAGAANLLTTMAPDLAARTDLANPRRLARALEVAQAGGGAGEGRLWSQSTRRPTVLLAVVRPRAVLDRLIAVRVRRELEEGLADELRAALATPGVAREPLQVIGAREVAALEAGELSPAELPARLEARTRRLARRQLAWLRKMPHDDVLDLGEGPAEAALGGLVRRWAGGT
jgi:tRNA dimethylallyltransferase